MTELYRITKMLAPKQRRERVVIRSQDGQMLTPEQQFRSILQYFKQAFSDPTPFWFSPESPAPVITSAEFQEAITHLQPRKAVPVNSVPPEVWKACPEVFASCLARDYADGVSKRPSQHSSPITDCSLTLLPKPHKATRLPQDLRPLGIQDPASKLVAKVLRERLYPQVKNLLHQAPQYAYTEGKSIDSAILRVVQHCKLVRNRLKEGALSVHARASGATKSTCFGGLMLGIDLSRAFDNLTRSVLLKALQHAQVDESLQRVLLEIHCQCSYELQHHNRRGLFSMEKGVRQGCSVSPMLYSLFTVWMMAELKHRVPPTWVEQCMTCFADDTHLAWCVDKPSDLQEICRTVREVFRLFKECNMVVNADKSSVVIGLRGSVAKRWQQEHTVFKKGVKGINFGTPTDPLIVPIVKQLTYLGIQASYGQFEMQTFRFRQQAASANRARLAKLLHSRQLALKRRLSLYLSCVRSSLIFGLHATGLNEAVLRRLESTDSRHLRALARSPSHITHESTAALRKRLQASSPATASQELLQRRISNCLDAQGRAIMQEHLHQLQKVNGSAIIGEQEATASGSGKLVPCHAEQQVACPVCGLYFPGMRIMLSHKARQHKPTPDHTNANCAAAKPSMPTARAYTTHIVDGLPKCKHCLAVFTRVEAMKKHLRGACPVLHGASDANEVQEGVATDSGATGALSQEGLLGHSCRVPQVALSTSPLIDDPVFLTALRAGWRKAADNATFLRILRKHCVYCHQWVSLKGSGVKQHHRIAHPEYWSRKDDACSLCSSAGLSTTTPCQYCGESYKDQRAHLKRCHVIYQIALASLTHAQAPAATHGSRCGIGGTGGAGEGVGRSGQGPGKAGKRGREGQGAGGAAQQVGETILQRLLRQGLPQPELESLGSRSLTVERPAAAGHCDDPPPAHSDKNDIADGGGTGQVSSGYLFHAVRGHGDGAEHPPAVEGCRPLVAGTVRGGHSHDSSSPCPLWGTDQEATGHPAAGPDGRLPAREAHDGGMVGRGQHGPHAQMGVLPLGPQSPSAGQGRAPAAGSRPRDALPGRADENGGSADGAAALPLGTQARPGDEGRGCALQAGSELARPSCDGLLHGSDDTVLQRGTKTPGPETPPGTHAEIGHGGGARGSLPVRSLHGLDETTSAVDEPGPAGEGEQVLEPRPVAMPAVCDQLTLQLPVVPPTQSLPAKLRNPHAVCYLNASAQAFCWIGNLLAAPRSCLGTAQAAVKLLRKQGSPYLPSCLPWGPLLRGWRALRQQNDVAEFMTHLLRAACPAAYKGFWQARYSNPCTVLDTGPLDAPLLLDLTGGSLQASVDAWTHQHAVYALLNHSGIVVVQLNRFKRDVGGISKDTAPLRIEPGESLILPIFAEASDTVLIHQQFRVAYVIYHHGVTPHSGHYQAALCSARGGSAVTAWHFYICNDNCAPRLAQPADLRDIHHNGYLIGLVRDIPV